jgi:subtilisin family serine protease/PKD repeat protein
MDKIRILCVFLLLAISVLSSAQSPDSNLRNVHPNILVVKLKSEKSPEARVAFDPTTVIDQIKSLAGTENAIQVFPAKSLSNARSSDSGLQNIYKLHLTPGTNLWKTLSGIWQSGLVEYAEPLYQNELLYIPNDPQANPGSGQQTYLSVIKAYEAWDIEKSDTSMVVGIVDTGVKMDHEDLQNIAYNYADPINGIDDDEDGYIDNFHGWDMADEDNDPTADGHPHGSPVTGMSSAATNNEIGMAGIGFNARYLPVKIAETISQKLTRDFEGVKYAADHGAKVINLSWGGAGNYSQYGQDIINYAVLEKDAVVVAAAGNTNEELDFYPASFDNVLSVGATDITDNKASWATYSYYIDIMAPGDNVYTTKNNGGYEITTGSSFASPLVAGAAALVRSRFPELNAIQVMEQLRVTSDDIYKVGQNMNYEGKLGKGRLNVQRALSDILTPSVRLSDIQYQSNHGDLIFPGDTVSVELEFTNFLRQAENLTISITNASGNATLQSEEIYISSLATFQTYINDDQPFTFIVSKDAQPGDRLFFRIDFLGNFYGDFQYFEIPLTPDYFEISDGNITATIASDGDIGFDDGNFREGNGISFGAGRIASNTGFIISQDKDHVINNAINDYGEFTRDQDFSAEHAALLYDNSIADYDARSVFKPSDTISSALPIRVEQKILAWDNSTANGYLIFEYRIINRGDSAINGLNAGIFADWDLGEYEANAGAADEELKLGYAFDKLMNNQYAGMALLTEQQLAHYAIDLFDLNGNTPDFDTIFSDSIKHEFLAGNTIKSQAGTEGNGNDVAQIVGARGFDLRPKETVKVAIAMLASNSLDGLKAALDLAKNNYARYQENPPEGQTSFACLGDSAVVDPSGNIYEFYKDLALTQRLDSGSFYKTPPVEKDTFYYAVNLDSGYYSDIVKLKVLPGNPTANFVLSTDTLLIESANSGQLTIQNTSTLGTSWAWDFGNGYASSVTDPVTDYHSAGTYTIELIASNDYGCFDTTYQQLLVAVRSDRPLLENQEICKNTSTTISASNTSAIRIYNDLKKSILLYEGNEYETDAIAGDTIFYVSNAAGDFESVILPVQIKVKFPPGGIEYFIDTTDLVNKYALTIYNSVGPVDSLHWYIDDEFVSRDSAFNYYYTDQAFEIMQVKMDKTGCTDTITTLLTPNYSTMPSLTNLEVCKDQQFTIRPEGESIFHFYADQQMTQLLHKGRSFSSPGISENTSYYVSNVDQLLESGSATILVSVNPVLAQITVTSDSVSLEEALDVEIINTSQNSMESFWIFPTGVFDTTKVLLENYDQTGIYNYTLVALGSNECSDTTFQKISVYTITDLESPLVQNDIRIYPNPTTTQLNVDLGINMKSKLLLELVNLSGKIIRPYSIPKGHSSIQINLDELPTGIYFLRSVSDHFQLNYKVVKK